MAKLSSEKYNILLIILCFIIPLIAINCSSWLITKINYTWEEKKQKNEAILEVETLAVESNFSTEFAIHFRDFFDEIQEVAKLDKTNNTFLTNHLKQASKKIFAAPFPSFNLYVFRIPKGIKQAELIYYDGSINTGKKTLCKAFEHLYNINIDKENKTNETFAKTLLGKLTDINAIAIDMRGITTNTNGIHKNSWFIWDYTNINNKGIYGAILLCNEIDNHAEYGRKLALEKLKYRGKAIGAFIPVYKDYGNANIMPPLDKSSLFKEWANSLTIKNIDELNHWLKESLPQNHKLGNYSAFCHLDRNSSHIAIILIKSKKILYFPKWLIAINIIFLLTLLTILYCGICFDIWPQLKLRTRFIISYILASVVPLSLLSVTAYGYLLEFENTSEELAKNELQLSLKSFDSYKLTSIKDYKINFNKVINDPKLVELIEEKGIDNELVTNYVRDYFQNRDSKNALPIIGVRIYDEIHEGNYSIGSAANNIDIKSLLNSFDSVLIELLREEMLKEDPDLKLKEYEINQEKDLAENAYFSLAGRELKIDIGKHFSVPLPLKNGDFCGYQIFDTIKINGKSKYMLFVLWDDKTLDEIIIQNAIKSNAFKNINQNFIAYKVKGQIIKTIGEQTRHASEDLKAKIAEQVKQSSYNKKTDRFVYDNNIIVVMPALNFNQIIFVGWKNKINIISNLFDRKIAFITLIFISLSILWICSLRSSSVFLTPITTLKKALDEVSLGNLNIGFKDNPNNELGKLSNEFGKMIEELREKERLSKLISDQAVQALKKNSSGLLNNTESFKAVALVSDIRNFTGMSEKYDPEIITELLNEHFAEMTKIISDNGGLIYKFIGDAIEAIFPEKSEYDSPASERAFKAGCMMLTKLKFINSRREKIGLFQYKIGVGLCYGTLYSGSVGSIETRLDYSILGDPLKKAAKNEALTIQNPDFPITIDETIAEKMAGLGLSFKKIDSKGQNFNVYTLDEIGNITNYKFSSINESIKNKDEEKKEKINYFSLSTNSFFSKKQKDLMFYSVLVLCISLLITFVTKLLHQTTYENLKSESNKYAVRLSEQLKCDAILKSCFETLCLEFYDDLKKLDFYKNPKNLKNKIEQIDLKYEKLGVAIPKYCCCFLDETKIPESERIVYKGFPRDITILMNNYTKAYKNYIEKYSKTENDLEREELIDSGEEILGSTLSSFTNKVTKFYDMNQGVFFRRSSPVTIGQEEMLFDTERIYDENQKNLIAYIFCGMPEKIDKDKLPNYYSLLAGKQMLMAMKSDKCWYFSPDFPNNEKKLFINNSNKTKIKNYYYEKIEIKNETFQVFIISKDLYSNYYSLKKYNFITFISSVIFFTFILWFLERNKLFAKNSIASILRKEIFLSAIMPILTVCFVANLYIEEESNANKSELILELNQKLNELENREYYYSPLCEYYLKTLPYSKDIQNYINKIINSNDEEKNKECDQLSNYLKKNISGRMYKKNSLSLKTTDPFIVIKEIMFVGKDGWIASAKHDNKDNKRSSLFGDIISELVKTAYFNKTNISNTKDTKDTKELKGELIAENTIKVLSSGYGSNVGMKLTNLPNNILIVASSYASIGIYIGCFPSINNPDYALVALIYFDNEFKPDICNQKNESQISYKAHLASNSKDNKIYCFYSPNINVGEFFFHDGWFINHKEELETVKELGLASSWINSSYLPLSKKIDIKGKHFLEAKQGNFIKDNVYTATVSEYPIHRNAFKNIITFASIIFFSLIMISLIAQSITLDLLDPVKKLIDGAGAVSKGEYKFRTNFTRKDELGTLCFSFDKMMKGLEEKQLMNRMVSKTALKVASNLSETNSKKVDVALLYVSVPDFDIIMKKTSPFELFSKLRDQIAIISDIVISNGGDIDKIMGEKMLIAFRLTNKTPEQIASEASKVASLIAKCPKLHYKVSVGVNYGEVISGYLGVGNKRDFTIIGDPVNVAARIAVFGERITNNKCLISETIYNYLSSNIKVELLGEIELKGKSQPMKVYRLI